jgi:hypothetical protein
MSHRLRFEGGASVSKPAGIATLRASLCSNSTNAYLCAPPPPGGGGTDVRHALGAAEKTNIFSFDVRHQPVQVRPTRARQVPPPRASRRGRVGVDHQQRETGAAVNLVDLFFFFVFFSRRRRLLFPNVPNVPREAARRETRPAAPRNARPGRRARRNHPSRRRRWS